MIKNYLKVAFRYLLRHKEYTLINVLGLAVGICCCILIMLFVRSEVSYDRFHSKSERLYRMYMTEKVKGEVFTNVSTPIPLAPALQSSFPEIETTSRVYSFNSLVKWEENSFNESVYMVDSSFFNMFDFRLVSGDRKAPFPGRNSVILNTQIAEKYFGRISPIGKTLQLQIGEATESFIVSAVIENAPSESSIQPVIMIPFSNQNSIFSTRAQKSWFNVFLETYVLLKESTSIKSLEAKVPAMVKTQLGEDYSEGGYVVSFQPIRDIHLNDKLPSGNEPISNPKYSYILGTIGLLVLLIACINFVTLSIGRSATRSLEVGVRKVLGAGRAQLIGQFWGEAVLLVLMAMITGILLAWLCLPVFNNISNKQLTFNTDWIFALYSLALLLVIGFIAGIYPAIVLSAFKPVQALKGRMQTAAGIGVFRKALIVAQFVASTVMIVCTLMIGRQMNYLQEKNLGFQRDQVVIIPTNSQRDKAMPVADRFRQEALKNPQIENISTVMFSFNEPGWVAMDYTDDERNNRKFRLNSVDAHFIPTMDIQLVAGRNFSEDNPADIEGSMIVNETLVKDYGWKDPIGKKLPGAFPQTIIGVVKDFNFESLHTPVRPLALVMKPDSAFRAAENIMFSASGKPRMMVRLKPGNLQSQIAILEDIWKKVAPNQDFEYTFLDDAISKQYSQETRLNTIVNVASGLSIFIACLGLFGLATLIVSRRTKEIGIRKVLGADTSALVMLLSKDFAALVIIAALISFPIAWWALNDWLQDFAYRVPISWWIFLIAGTATFLVALLTVSFQTIKAAMSNPVKSLRTE
ncbi:FtsX-like permease family protein [Flavihumibacter sp. R14]|nr:FtsX-like permease family protein [Flavihumibacter soli]